MVCELVVPAWDSSSLTRIPGPPVLGTWSLSHLTTSESLFFFPEEL